MKKSVAVCIPTRGLVYAQTLADILANLDEAKVNYQVFIASGLPLPDSHNTVVDRGFKSNPDYLWLVEDDMALPPYFLSRQIKLLDYADVVTCDYPDTKTTHVLRTSNGILIGGLGSIVMKPKLWEEMRPFTGETCYQWPDLNRIPQPDWHKDGGYNSLDIDFYVRLQEAGKKIVSAGNCGQYKWTDRPVRRQPFVIEKWEF